MKRETYTVEGAVYRNLREVSNAYEDCKYNTLVKRLNRGLPIYDAIYSDKWTQDSIPFEEQVYGSVEELAAATGKPPEIISSRLENGWLVWLAVTTPPGYVIDGKEFSTLKEVAAHYKMNYHTLQTRIRRDGMRLYDAVYYGKPVVWDGVSYSSRKEMCDKLEIHHGTLNRLLYQGKPMASVVKSLLSFKHEREKLRIKRKERLTDAFEILINAYYDRIEASFLYADSEI